MIVISGYTIQEKIHQNHNIDTYYALRGKDRRKVLLKIPTNQNVSSDNLAILQHEFHLLKQIDTPTILKAYDFLQNAPVPVLIMEGVEGQTLHSYLNMHQLTLKDFFKLALQLVEILSVLHQLNIIHKEINPFNTLIDPQTLTLKLIDLSASTMLSEETIDYMALKSFKENLAYISPEQTGRINRPIDYRTDFYSLGVTFYQMLTNELPFPSTDLLELVHCHIAIKPPSILEKRPDVPDMVIAIIDKLLQKMPEERYSSIIGLKSDLLECQKQWQDNHGISSFSLGLHDVKDHLSIVHNLYGRSQEVEQLLQAFNRVSKGSKELVLIAGYSGIGKTSLVKEVQKPIIQHRCYYIQGKFDQLQRNIPYSAIVSAFQNLVKQVLAESEADLAALKEHLLSSLGKVGQVVIDVIPEVELIIGEQPPVPKLNPSDTQIRFNLVFQNFVQIFAQANHPLVMFLDDLQWADNSSLNFIDNLLQDRNMNYLLIIGAYRNNEINESHPLQLTINNLKKNDVELTIVTPQPLQLEDTQQLLQDTLSGSLDDVRDLAACIFNKTHGNPFFINEFIKMLYEEKILFFSYAHGAWEWDLNKVVQQSATDNVVDLLTVKIHLLPKTTQEILRLAACFGYSFDFKTLLIISNQSISQIAECLYQAILANLIFPLEESYKTSGLVGLEEIPHDFSMGALHYRFAHDRIQQASYGLIGEQERPQLHLKIGRLLLKDKPLKENDEHLFDVMKHFNQSIFLIKKHTERKRLAKYNLWAGQRAKLSSAYDTANQYLSSGLALLDESDIKKDWEEGDKLVFQLYKELAVCKYLIGDIAQSDQYFTDLFEHITKNLNVLEVYQLKIEMLASLAKHREALELGLSALRYVGIQIPKKINKLNMLIAIYKVRFQTRNILPEHIVLPRMLDLKQKAIADLITTLLTSAYMINQKLFVMLTCILLSLSLKSGYADGVIMSSPVYAFLIMHSLSLYEEAVSLVKLYRHLKQKYGAFHWEGRQLAVLGGLIEPYQASIDNATDTLTKAFKLCCEGGDLVYSDRCNILLTIHSLSAGHALSDVKKNIQSALSFMSRANLTDVENICLMKFLDYSTQCLIYPASDAREQFACFEESLIKEQNKSPMAYFYSFLARFYLILGNFEEAIQAGENHELFSGNDIGSINHLDCKFYYALALFSQMPQFTKAQQRLYVKKLKKLTLFIEKYARWCPENFKVYSLLLEAEWAALKDQHALFFYGQAINTALASKSILVAAIASERAGRYCISKQIEGVPAFYLHNAYQYFKEWGASTKLKLLEETYPAYIQAHDDSGLSNTLVPQNTVQTLDMLAILKFTQLISSEIHLDKLLQKFMLIVLENAGAQKSIILTKINDKWIVEAEGNPDQQFVYLKGVKAADAVSKYPLSILNYVERTKKPLIINDALQSELTFKDPYVQKEKPRSILIMPLFHQGQFCRILYLEHKDSSDTFTSEHIESLQLLCSQAMTSLENAKLYYQATHDPLTGLANRNMFYELFQQTINQAVRTQGKVALLFLDLDYFKKINDTLGHDAGDLLLVHVAELLTSIMREGDLAARLGGDEFVLMLAHFTSYKHITNAIERLFHELSKPFRAAEHTIQITTSIGVSIFPKDAKDVQSLLKLADTALYQAKEQGRNQFCYYSTKLSRESQMLHGLDKELQDAYANQEFFLMYQPIHEVSTGKIIGLEALLRWNHPERGILEPKDFFAILEKSPLIIPVGEWILRTACRQAKIWQDKDILSGSVAVNLSAVQLLKHSLHNLVADVLADTRLKAASLELEITETAIIDYGEQAPQEIEKLLALGINLSLDDFGTGYSAFSYLKIIPVNKIKIDKAFINNCTHDYLDQTIIYAITTMAHRLNITVIAEGVENEQQLKTLQAQGIDGVQGYIYSSPLTVECCETYLERRGTNTKSSK